MRNLAEIPTIDLINELCCRSGVVSLIGLENGEVSIDVDNRRVNGRREIVETTGCLHILLIPEAK